METFLSTTYPNFLAALDKRIAANSSQHHIVGDSMTIAGFAVASWFFAMPLNEGNAFHKETKEVLDKYPHVKEYLNHLAEHELKEFLANRPSPRPFWELFDLWKP